MASVLLGFSSIHIADRNYPNQFVAECIRAKWIGMLPIYGAFGHFNWNVPITHLLKKKLHTDFGKRWMIPRTDPDFCNWKQF
jgi:hypothetical protein